MNKPEIARIMTISTSHIDKDTADLLDNCVDMLSEGELPEVPLTIIEKAGYGWIIYTADTKDMTYKLPRPLANCLRYADNYGCAWLAIDADGPTMDDLPTYERD